jgi:hypothetical protein
MWHVWEDDKHITALVGYSEERLGIAGRVILRWLLET